MSALVDRLNFLFTAEGGWGKCPKCYYSMVEMVDVLDANDQWEGKSQYCRQCHWLEIQEPVGV